MLGGTFDPVHVGHLVAALEVRYELGLDRVLLVPTGHPWQKVGTRTVTPGPDRLAVVAAAVAGIDGLGVSSVDVDRDGPTYTADTLDDLRRDHPGAELVLILGADAAAGIPTWVRPEEVRASVELVVVTRPGATVPAGTLEGWRWRQVVIPALEISSTDLRRRFAEGAPVDFLVPAGAIREIAARRLYASGR